MSRGRAHISDQRGFTMVELLVVILIVGILAIIALPSFIGPRAKGQDDEAQTTIRTAQLAIRTYETDHDTFDATRTDLEKIEPTIADASAAFDVSGTATTFTISERSSSGTVFTLTRDGSSDTTRTCDVPGRGLCRTSPDGDGNTW
jgi:type IV pilus assembly protein PilA